MGLKYFNLENRRKKFESAKNFKLRNWPKNSIWKMGEKKWASVKKF